VRLGRSSLTHYWFASTSLLALLALAPRAHAQVELYATAFDDSAGWTLTQISTSSLVRWDVRVFPLHYSFPAPSPVHALGFTAPSGGWPSGYFNGEAVSPVVDIGGSALPVLSFQYFWDHEEGCLWDAFGVDVRSATTGAVFFTECLSLTGLGSTGWTERRIALDPAWGPIQVVFTQDTIDSWNVWETGCWVDDMRIEAYSCQVQTECFGAPLSTGAPGARLEASGTTSVTARDLVVTGTGFPTHSFAAAFAGPDAATIPIGNGVRCIGAGTSVRLAVAPTRALGEAFWNLDLGAAPLAQIAVVGQPLYVQTIFRDGASMNLSDALRLEVCP
jgi:hypothetical protein